MKLRLFGWFLLAQILAGLFVFREAIWGGALLAPLDIAPALYSKYRFLDPSSSGLPANHYIGDQITYNLPIQWTIYDAFQRGEIPWWDPYAGCGRPLLADATINGTEPVRCLAYLLLPFEAAYNWTRIVHFILSGLGMLLLLRRAGFKDWQCLGLALPYEFAGLYTMSIGHHWIQSSFNYYPFLWIAWDAACAQGKRWGTMAAALLIAGIFYTGNAQSHAFLVVFTLAFGLGYAGRDWKRWRQVLPPLIVSGLLGACLAAPVLLSQVELYVLSTRKSFSSFQGTNLLAGIGSLSAVYPWCLGTFRTLDASKLLGWMPVGFSLFIGSAAFLLAVLGTFIPPQKENHRTPRPLGR